MRSNTSAPFATVSTPKNTQFAWQFHVFLGAIALLALGLRLWGIGWGLPYADQYHDEQTVARVILGMIGRRDWNPRFFEYPSLYLYALRLVFDVHWHFGLASGLYTPTTHLPRRWEPYVTLTGFYIWGRVLTAVVGVATVALLAHIGRRWWNARIGLAAALALAVLPFHIRLSQTLRVDVAGAFTTLLGLATALRLIERGDWGSYALAGFVTGLAAATKYNAGAVALAILGAHGIRWSRASLRQSWRIAWAGVWCCVGFGVATPYALLSPAGFWHGIFKQFADYRGGTHGDWVGRWPVAAYGWFFGTTGFGPLPILVAVLGIATILRRRDRAGYVLLAFGAPYLLFFLAWPQHFWRNLLPIVPPLALFAGIGIDVSTAWLAARLKPLQRRYPTCPGITRGSGMLTLTAIVIALPLLGAIQLDWLDARPDPRVQAAAYLQHNLPDHAAVAVELDPHQWIGYSQIIPMPALTDHNADWYRARGIRYLVASSAQRTPEKQQLYDRLRTQATLLQIFDNQPRPLRWNIAWMLVSSLAGSQTGVWVEVLDLGPLPTTWTTPKEANPHVI